MSNTSEEVISIPFGHAMDVIKNSARAQWITGERLANTPALIGPPGAGKTAALRQMGNDLGRELGANVLVLTKTLVDMEVTDIRGMALPTKDPTGKFWERLVYTRSALLPSPEVEAAHDHILLIVDELPAATLDHVKSVASLLLEYTVGEVALDPRKYFVVATGNGTQHRSGATKLPAHVVNRLSLMHVEADVTAWLKWAARPSSMVPPVAAAFVEQLPTRFTDATVPAASNTPFCTFRSFTNGVRGLLVAFGTTDEQKGHIDTIDALDAALAPDNAAKATSLLAASIGRGVAHEFVQYARIRTKLTSKTDILADPLKAKLPDESDMSALYAQSLYCAAWTTERKTAEAMLAYVARFRGDLIVPTVERMGIAYEEATGGKSLVAVKGYSDLAQANLGLFMSNYS